MMVKIENGVFLVLLTTLAGCAVASRTDDGSSSPLACVLVPSPVSAGIPPQPKPVVPPRISRWLATAKIDFSLAEAESGLYRLSIETPEPMTADQLEFVPVYFRHRVAESFANRNALDSGQVAVAVLSENFESKAYRIVATACGVNDVSLAYDPLTRRGSLSMKIRNGDFDGTRKLIRQHIEMIVRDKNIQLVTGVPPPPGQYRILGESVRPGNVLEVNFKTE